MMKSKKISSFFHVAAKEPSSNTEDKSEDIIADITQQETEGSSPLQETQELDVVHLPRREKISLPSLNDTIESYDQWKLKIPDDVESLSRSKRFKWKAKYNPRIKQEFPWLVEVVVDKCVVGILCSICRDHVSDSHSSLQFERNKGKFVSVPFVKFGDLREAAREHEFGKKSDKFDDATTFRAKVLHGEIKTPCTTHMEYYINDETKKKYAGKSGIDNTIKNMSHMVVNRNHKGMLQLCSLLHRTIKRRDSPYSSLKDGVCFSIEVLECDNLKMVLQKGKGVSHRKINELMDAIYSLVMLGIYVEMTDGLKEGEEIMYGGTIDLGSKIQKTKEYAGVGVKYCILSQKTSMTRVIAFPRCVYKTGAYLINVFQNVVCDFNDKIRSLKVLLGHLFPVKLDFLPKLELTNMQSLAVDGALISKNLQLNQRILEHNPRCIVSHCGNHKAALVSTDSIKENERVEEAHRISSKLFDLVHASPKFDELFRQSQEQTGESMQFKANKPVSLSDRPMHRWESTLKFNTKVLKLVRTCETFLAEVLERGWAKDARQTSIFPANYLRDRFPQAKYLLTIATETDVLEILVAFIKKTEYIDNDLMVFLESVEDVELELQALMERPGRQTKKMIHKFLKGDFNEWLNDEEDEAFLMAMNTESIEMYQDLWKNRFADKTKLEMFLFFSIRLFRREVTCLQDVSRFGVEYEKQLAQFYCEEVEFIAQYPEAKGESFVAMPLGDEDDLFHEMLEYKRYVFRNYMSKNPATQSNWTTKELLLDMLLREEPDIAWLNNSTMLCQIMKNYLVQITESCDIERLMSVFTLYDNKLNQASEPETVEKTVIIQKESPSWDLFDSEAVLTIWRKQKDKRRIKLPPITMQTLEVSLKKSWLKPLSVLKQSHEKRKELFFKRMEINELNDIPDHEEYNTDDSVDEDDDDHDDNEEDESEEEDEDIARKDVDAEGEELEDSVGSEDIVLTSTLKLSERSKNSTDTLKTLQIKNDVDDEAPDDAIPAKKKKYCYSDQTNYVKSLKELHSSYLKLPLKTSMMKERYQDDLDVILSGVPNYSLCNRDDLSSVLIPIDICFQNPVALSSAGDGNCLFNSISLLLTGNQRANTLLRMLTSIELYQNANDYINHSAVDDAATALRRKKELLFPDILSPRNGQEEWYLRKNMTSAIKHEAIAVSKEGSYSSFITLMAVATVIRRPIYSVYPEVKFKLRKLFHQKIHPCRMDSSLEPFSVMWTRSTLDTRPGALFIPNHFVPIIEDEK